MIESHCVLDKSLEYSIDKYNSWNAVHKKINTIQFQFFYSESVSESDSDSELESDDISEFLL